METSRCKAVKESIRRYFLPYTLLFLILQFLIFITFYHNSRTFIWYYDGAYQHYPAITYYSTFLKSLFSGQGLTMIDFSLGLGFDTITTLTYYVIGDPLTLLSVFATPNSMELFYSILVLLRLFLVGFSFLLFCIYKKKSAFPSILGSLVYVFSSFALYAGLRHPFFLNPLIYLPLLLIGIDRLVKTKKGLFFSIVVALSALSNFYFFYMLTIITFIYVIVHYFLLKSDNESSATSESKNITTNFITLLQCLGYYLLGIGLSGILLFPTMYAFLHNGRLATGGSCSSLLHYDTSYYRCLPRIMFTFGQDASHWTIIGVSIIASLCTIIVLFSRKKKLSNKILFFLCTLFLMIPFLGSMMNGFSSPTNRWTFAFTFLLSYFVANGYNELFRKNKKAQVIMLIFVISYSFYAIIYGDLYVRIPALLLVMMLLWVFLWSKRLHGRSLMLRNAGMLFLVSLNLVISSNLLFSSLGLNYSKEFLTYGKINQYTTSPAQEDVKISNHEFYRFQDQLIRSPNLSLTTHNYGTSFYFSLMNKYIYQYMLDLSNSSLRFASQFLGFDNRTFLLSLNGVKYYVSANPNDIPYGFRLMQHVNSDKYNYYIYENMYALPLGYTYDSYLPYKSYQQLTPLQKQEALMQCILLESPPKKLKKGNPQYSIIKVPATISYNHITYNNHQILVEEPKGSFELSYNAPPNNELYVAIDNLSVAPSNLNKISLRTKTDKTHNNYTTVRAPYDRYYFGMNSRLINLGFHIKSSKKSQIIFDQSGTFTLGAINLYAQSMDHLQEYYKDRTKNVLSDITINDNTITGQILSDHDQMLLLMIPYSSGWSVTLNGTSVPTYRANTMYTAIDLPPGNHSLVLKYRTPYLTHGMISSLLSLLLCFLHVLISRNKTKRKRTNTRSAFFYKN